MKKIIICTFLLLVYSSLSFSQWIQTKGPYGGSVNSIVKKGTKIFAAGTSGGGVFVSTNNGVTWIAKNNGLSTYPIQKLFVHNNKLFASTTSGSASVYVSTNDGENWLPTSSSSSSNIIDFASSGNKLFAASSGYIYVTTDDGANWVQLTDPTFLDNTLSCIAVNNDIMFAATINRVFYSTNEGVSWNPTYNISPDDHFYSLYTKDNILMAGCSSLNYNLVFSWDYGQTWSIRGNGLDFPPIAIISDGTNFFAATSYGVYVSSDMGLNWSRKVNGHPEFNVKALLNSDNILFSGTGSDGIYLSTNKGELWQQSSTGLLNSNVSSLDAIGNIVIAGAGKFVYLSSDFGESWNKISNMQETVATINIVRDFYGDTCIWAGTSGGIYRTKNFGQTWTKMTSGFYTNPSAKCTAILQKPGGSYSIFLGQESFGFWRSFDDGINWTNTYLGGNQYNKVGTVSAYDSLAIAGTINDGVYRSTNMGNTWAKIPGQNFNYGSAILGSRIFLSNQGGLLVSSDKGETWVSGGNYPSSFIKIYSNNKVFLLNNEGVRLSNDNGLNWSIVNTGLTFKAARSIAFTDNYMFLGTAFGGCIWRRSKQDLSLPVELTSFNSTVKQNSVELNWVTETELNNKGFYIERKKNELFESIAFVTGKGTSQSKTVYSFVDKNVPPGRYLYKLKQVDFDGSEKYSDLIEVNVSFPSEFILEQNYPNPFNPITTINYSLPSKSDVTVKVYDILGNEIAILINEVKDAGNYSVQFKAADIPSGVYFYKLKAGSNIAVKKMSLIK